MGRPAVSGPRHKKQYNKDRNTMERLRARVVELERQAAKPVEEVGQVPVPLNFNKRQVLYELLNNNQWGASLHTGAIVSSMRSVGGVSVQKQSFVIASVIQLLWGLPSKAQSTSYQCRSLRTMSARTSSRKSRQNHTSISLRL